MNSELLLESARALWPLWGMAGLVLALRVGLLLRRWRRLARSGIAAIDEMTGPEFEARLARLFHRLGWEVERTPESRDFGADLLLRRGEETRIVQAKRSARSVGVKAVQEAVAARAFYGCDGALVVTNGGFTAPAAELAEANEVELWGREELVRALLCR